MDKKRLLELAGITEQEEPGVERTYIVSIEVRALNLSADEVEDAIDAGLDDLGDGNFWGEYFAADEEKGIDSPIVVDIGLEKEWKRYQLGKKRQRER